MEGVYWNPLLPFPYGGCGIHVPKESTATLFLRRVCAGIHCYPVNMEGVYWYTLLHCSYAMKSTAILFLGGCVLKYFLWRVCTGIHCYLEGALVSSS